MAFKDVKISHIRFDFTIFHGSLLCSFPLSLERCFFCCIFFSWSKAQWNLREICCDGEGNKKKVKITQSDLWMNRTENRFKISIKWIIWTLKSASKSQHFKNAQLISAVVLIKHLRNWIVCTCLSKRMNVNVSINYSIFSFVLSLRLFFFLWGSSSQHSTNESEGTLNPIIDSSTEIGSSFQFWFCPFSSLSLSLRFFSPIQLWRFEFNSPFDACH